MEFSQNDTLKEKKNDLPDFIGNDTPLAIGGGMSLEKMASLDLSSLLTVLNNPEEALKMAERQNIESEQVIASADTDFASDLEMHREKIEINDIFNAVNSLADTTSKFFDIPTVAEQIDAPSSTTTADNATARYEGANFTDGFNSDSQSNVYNRFSDSNSSKFFDGPILPEKDIEPELFGFNDVFTAMPAEESPAEIIEKDSFSDDDFDFDFTLDENDSVPEPQNIEASPQTVNDAFSFNPTAEPAPAPQLVDSAADDNTPDFDFSGHSSDFYTIAFEKVSVPVEEPIVEVKPEKHHKGLKGLIKSLVKRKKATNDVPDSDAVAKADEPTPIVPEIPYQETEKVYPPINDFSSDAISTEAPEYTGESETEEAKQIDDTYFAPETEASEPIAEEASVTVDAAEEEITENTYEQSIAEAQTQQPAFEPFDSFLTGETAVSLTDTAIKNINSIPDFIGDSTSSSDRFSDIFKPDFNFDFGFKKKENKSLKDDEQNDEHRKQTQSDLFFEPFTSDSEMSAEKVESESIKQSNAEVLSDEFSFEVGNDTLSEKSDSHIQHDFSAVDSIFTSFDNKASLGKTTSFATADITSAIASLGKAFVPDKSATTTFVIRKKSEPTNTVESDMISENKAENTVPQIAKSATSLTDNIIEVVDEIKEPTEIDDKNDTDVDATQLSLEANFKTETDNSDDNLFFTAPVPVGESADNGEKVNDSSTDVFAFDDIDIISFDISADKNVEIIPDSEIYGNLTNEGYYGQSKAEEKPMQSKDSTDEESEDDISFEIEYTVNTSLDDEENDEAIVDDSSFDGAVKTESENAGIEASNEEQISVVMPIETYENDRDTVENTESQSNESDEEPEQLDKSEFQIVNRLNDDDLKPIYSGVVSKKAKHSIWLERNITAFIAVLCGIAAIAIIATAIWFFSDFLTPDYTEAQIEQSAVTDQLPTDN